MIKDILLSYQGYLAQHKVHQNLCLITACLNSLSDNREVQGSKKSRPVVRDK